MAAYARRELLSIKDLHSQLPEHSFRAFLHCIELENYLSLLEQEDFDLFSPRVQKQSYWRLFFKMSRAARKGHFLRDFMHEPN